MGKQGSLDTTNYYNGEAIVLQGVYGKTAVLFCCAAERRGEKHCGFSPSYNRYYTVGEWVNQSLFGDLPFYLPIDIVGG